MTHSPPSHRRLLITLGALYLAQGVPGGYAMIALPAILTTRGMGLASLGLLGITLLPWVLKGLWAPWLDNRNPPLFARCGRRVGWIFCCQAVSIPAFAAIAWLDPIGQYPMLLSSLIVVNTLFATQDIAVDALAVNTLRDHGWLGANAVQTSGFSLGMLIGGSTALVLVEGLGFRATTFTLALLPLCALLPLATVWRHFAQMSASAGGASILTFLRQPYTPALIVLVLAYKLPAMLGHSLINPLLVKQGAPFWLISVTSATLVAIIATVVAHAAPRTCATYGVPRTIGALVALTGSSWAALGLSMLAGKGSIPVTIAMNGFAYAAIVMATVPMYALFMSLASANSAGTDYTLCYSIEALANLLAMTLSGLLAQSIGFAPTFLIAGAAGMLVSPWIFRRLQRPLAQIHPAATQT